MGTTLSFIEHDSAFVGLGSNRTFGDHGLPSWAPVEDVLVLEDAALLPTFRGDDGHRLVLRSDLEDYRDVFACLKQAIPRDLFGRDPLSVMVGGTTRVDVVSGEAVSDPGYYAGLRNLCRLVRRGVRPDAPVARLPYFGCGTVETTSREVIQEVRRQTARNVAVTASDAGQFAHSAYYMGSKRALRSFIVEAVGNTAPGHGIVVDLMCGSGAAAGAFSRLWRTVASDAQEFCRILATVQGGGYERRLAEARIPRILDLARRNTAALRELVGDAVGEEEELFHSDLDENTLQRYRDFVARWPTYPGGSRAVCWDPNGEVQRRKAKTRTFPYCLFTAYYANVYFGLRQAVEIDALRYAIEQLSDRQDRMWALGALIASVSALGSTFGGHFAQPAIRRPAALTIKKVGALMEVRAASITHEFCARYLNLATESEAAAYPVETVRGPWQTSLDSVHRVAGGRKDVTVYLDAPYTREEYSRYYHLLETLVRYGYPDSIGAGRVPSKIGDGRFRSEFFTRSSDRLVNTFRSVILSILERGWVCAWSYSDRGGVGIPRIVEEVRRGISCGVRSYAAPYTHKALGARRAKPVVEHVVVFCPG